MKSATVATPRPRWAWPEYGMEGALLGLFMVSACFFTVALEHPASPLHTALRDPLLRRALIGLAMGSTAICLILSPWGQQSGAHMNPAVTLTFWRLGRVRAHDALCFLVAQALGAIAGVGVSRLLLGARLADPAVNYAVTLPGARGMSVAFLAEFTISALLMLVVLIVGESTRWAPRTPFIAGSLVALYITFEAPLSGMSMNPARSLGSMVWAGGFSSFWIYLLAPPLGMLTSAGLFTASRGLALVHCAKLHHDNDKRCIHCGARFKSSWEEAA
ncbi:MAG: aquaporin [Acidobacteriota bacterium]